MRTDASIRADVENELRWDQTLDEKCIAVRVANCSVTLTGTVRRHSDRIAAEAVARRVAGVQTISNAVEVKMPQQSERYDIDSSGVNADLESTDVKVPAEAGRINPSGHATNGYRGAVEEKAVRCRIGVKGVVNKLTGERIVNAKDSGCKMEQPFQGFPSDCNSKANTLNLTQRVASITFQKQEAP